jgi:hypothetical protein
MKKIVSRAIAVSMIMSLICVQLDARVRTKQSGREFDQQVSKSHLMVVLFYSNSKEIRKGTAEKNDVNQLLRMYERVSSKKLYDDADVTFVKVNVDAQVAGLLPLRYGIKEFPAFIIFNKGRIITESNGENAVLTGFVSEMELQYFIRQHCDAMIRAVVVAKEQERQKILKDSRDASKPYFYPSTLYTPSGHLSSWTKPLKYDAEGNEQ